MDLECLMISLSYRSNIVDRGENLYACQDLEPDSRIGRSRGRHTDIVRVNPSNINVMKRIRDCQIELV